MITKPDAVSQKFGESANGHNGVRSVISVLGTSDFHRLRIGIGENEGVDAAEYVLGGSRITNGNSGAQTVRDWTWF